MRIELEPSYILHARPFRDTSVILDCLTENYGRVSLLGKGVRSAKSKQKQLCQPFIPLFLSWQGKSQLKTIIDVESRTPAHSLRGQYLFSAFYINELLTRVLVDHDPCSEIFERYQLAMSELSLEYPLEPVLRQFELGLLLDLGYSISLSVDAGSGEVVENNLWYEYVPEKGLVICKNNSANCQFSGKHLLAFEEGDFSDVDTLRQAKKLMRLLLKPLVGNKPLKSRELFLKNNNGGRL